MSWKAHLHICWSLENGNCIAKNTHIQFVSELGNSILKYRRSVSRHFSVKTTPDTAHSSISSMLMMDCKLTPLMALRVVGQLATCLDFLHLSSLVIGNLNTNTVFLSIVKKKVSLHLDIILYNTLYKS